MKNLLLLILLIGATISVFIAGNVYQSNVISANEASFLEHKKKNDARLEKEREELLASIDPNQNKDTNLVEQLKFKELNGDEIKIGVIGSSVALGSGATRDSSVWSNVFKSNLATTENDDLRIIDTDLENFSEGGFKAGDLIKNGNVEELLKYEPTLVLFETGVINSHSQNENIETTKSNIEELYEKISEKLPDSIICVVSPNPISDKESKENELGLTYKDYLNDTKDLASDNDWVYFDSYDNLDKFIKDNKLEIDDVLADGIHPNDQLYKEWGRLFTEYANKD